MGAGGKARTVLQFAPPSLGTTILLGERGTRTSRRVVKEPPVTFDAGNRGLVEGVNALLL
jgi:hypothetical protein